MTRVDVRQHRCRAGPELVILAAGTIFQGDASTNLGRPLGQTDLHLFQLPDEAVADQFDSPMKVAR